MKTIGWAAIIYTVHDAYTFGALCLLIAGEIGAAYLRKPAPRRATNIKSRALS
jgi:hypothetical protein